MLNFKQKTILSTVMLLSLSLNSFADTIHKQRVSTNLVELFKDKAQSKNWINSVEAKLLVTNEAEQEELLVELAQSLLYYQEHHNKNDDRKTDTSKKVSSYSTNTITGKVSKKVKSKDAYSTLRIYRKAFNAYKKASKLSLDKKRIKYTRELSELSVKLSDKSNFVQIFNELLQHGEDEKGMYIAHIDYADGLHKFKDRDAETQFLSAVNMRNPVDGVEAYFRYARYLVEKNKFGEALIILEQYTFEERQTYIHIAMLRQEVMHQLKLNTHEVDSEMKQLRKNISNISSLVVIPKFMKRNRQKGINIIDLPTAHAFAFSHNNESDDTRGASSNSWITWYHKNSFIYVGKSYQFSTVVISTAEVVYNEFRGSSLIGRRAMAWAIRNRATIDMNGCDFYPGSESDPIVETCRNLTPIGPSLRISDVFRRYSCVVHGGTNKVGAVQSEMNDSHVDIEELVSSGVIWEVLSVIYGWIPDPTSSNVISPSTYPEKEMTKGNTDGAQEWNDKNYCSHNGFCKNRLGNVGGFTPDPGSLCPHDGNYSAETFFWGRRE